MTLPAYNKIREQEKKLCSFIHLPLARKAMQKKFIILILSALIMLGCFNFAYAQRVEIGSSPNPVGSGAIALGMGGAYIAMAYDATAASWNPACLIRLDYPELSIVGYGFHRTENNKFGGNYSGASGSHNVDKTDLNYASFARPFHFEFDIFGKKYFQKMVISLNYQRLYNFKRDWKWEFSDGIGKIRYDYQQDGDLSALGIACCVGIVPTKLSIGFTLNLWNDGMLGLINNKWEENEHFQRSISGTTIYETHFKDQYSFRGTNFNIGMLWNIGGHDKLRIGAVFKRHFTAALKHEIIQEGVDPPRQDYNEQLDMPMSYGIGFSWEPPILDEDNDLFTIAGDVYRTEWKDYVIRNTNGDVRSPITNDSPGESNVRAITQIRLGAEYLIIRPESDWAYSIRGGIFYDPIPDRGNPEDVYGFSIGGGIVGKLRVDKHILKKFSWDIAYQYRYGDDVGTAMFMEEDYQFSQDIKEHTVYSSVILYF